MLLLLLSCTRSAPPDGLPPSVGGERPAALVAPADWDGVSRLPVVLLLHGLGSSAGQQDRYLRLSRQVDEQGFLLVLPDGLPRDKDGQPAWNATPACCKWNEEDDVAYLSGLMDELEAFPVDGFHVTGHSNGGFMSYRLACEDERVEAIASLAGSTFLTREECRRGQPVDVLQIHGTDDETVPFGGKPDKYPGAQATVERWAGRAGCTGSSALEPVDLVIPLGAETTRTRWDCPEHRVELWAMAGVGHIPPVRGSYSRDVVAWLLE